MTLVIDDDKCARCGVCALECPHEAITQTEDSYIINPALCTECKERYGEPLCEAVCPNDSIHKIEASLYKKCLSIFG